MLNLTTYMILAVILALIIFFIFKKLLKIVFVIILIVIILIALLYFTDNMDLIKEKVNIKEETEKVITNNTIVKTGLTILDIIKEKIQKEKS